MRSAVSHPQRTTSRIVSFALAPVALALTVACSNESAALSGPEARPLSAAAATIASTSFTLASVTPPIVCTDASGATTTVTGGVVTLSSNGKFTARFTTQTTSSAGVTTTASYTEKGSYTSSGTAITFKTADNGTLSGTLENGTLTIADYPFCGSTHTAVFVQS